MKKYVGNLMPHYGLRKLPIGVASVLLSMSAAVITGHADSAVNNSKNTSVTANVNEDNINNSYQEKSQSSAINSDSNTDSTSEIATDAQQRSASESDNNSVSNSVNVQGASPVINTYSDNKVIVQNSNRAGNVDIEGYNWSTGGGHNSSDPSKLNNGNPIPWAWTIYWTLRGSFDLTEQQLKSKNQIDLGTISESLSPVKSYSYYPRVNFGDNQLRLKDGSSVGYYYMNGNQLMVGLFGNYQGIGSQHFHFDQVNCETGYMASTACFRGKGAMNTTLTWQIGDHKYSTKIAKPGMAALIGPGHRDISADAWNKYGSRAIGNDMQVGWSIASELTPEQLDAWDKSNGKSIGTPLKDDNVSLTYIFKIGGNDTLSPSSIHVEKRGETMDSQGRLHEDSGSHFANSYGGGVDDPLSDNYRVTNAGDGLTIDDLKKLKPNNNTGFTAYWSRQSDGTALVYVYMPADDLKIKNFATLKEGLNDSSVINLDPNPQKAIDNTIDYYKNHNPLGGYPSSTNFVLWYGRADNTKVTHTEITYYDPVTEQPINKTPLKGIWGTSVNTVDGQSSVKLHVINATTGAAITQVKSFTDWPNQGKHADLAVPTVANYRLITDVNAANAVLAKYHLSGHVLTGNASVDYPAENTISDYYLVMTPTQENITVNIEDDDDQKILNTDTVTVKEDNSTAGLDDVNAQIKQLLDSGKYTLESSELNQIAFNGPKVLTIKLKHKLVSTTRQYRIIEKLPDGTEKVIVSLKTTLYKDANNGYYSDMGAYNDGTGDKQLKANETIDYAGISPDGQNPSTWLKAKIDQFTGYVMHFDDAMDAYHYQDGVNVSLGDNNTYAYFDLFNGSQPRGTADNISQSPMASRDFYITYTREIVPATLQIVDQDEGTILDSVKITGNYGDVISNADFNAKLQALLNTGHYEIVSNDLIKTLLYGDGNPTYTVTLKHHIDSTKRHYRIIEELPNGTNKVIVDLDATLYKDATSDTYITHGAFVDSDYHKKLLKANDYIVHAGTFVPGYSDDYLQAPVDRVTGYSAKMTDGTNGFDDIIYAGFNDQNYQILFDLFNGWIEDGKVGVSTKNPLASRDFHIIYTKNQYPVTIAYYDLSGQLVSTSTKQYYYRDVVDVAGQAPENYVLANGQEEKVKVGTDTNEVDLLVMPKMKTTKETRPAVRLINVERIDGEVTTIEQMVTWIRDVTENLVSGEKITGEWHSVGADTMAAWSAPVVDGYQTPSIAALKTTPDTGVVTVLLKYQQNDDYDKPRYLDVNGQAYDDLPDGYQVVNGQSGDYGLLIVKSVNPVTPTPRLEYVTRLITVIVPNGQARIIKQRAVKGSYFVKAHLPHLKGFKCTIDGDVDRVIANDNMTAVVKFVKL